MKNKKTSIQKTRSSKNKPLNFLAASALGLSVLLSSPSVMPLAQTLSDNNLYTTTQTGESQSQNKTVSEEIVDALSTETSSVSANSSAVAGSGLQTVDTGVEQEYVETKDSTVQKNVDYYTYDSESKKYTKATPDVGSNISEGQYYVLQDVSTGASGTVGVTQYVKATGTAQAGRTYYSYEGSTYTPVASSNIEVGTTDVSSYYLLNGADVSVASSVVYNKVDNYTKTTDTKAVSGKNYYTYDNATYTLATLTAGDTLSGDYYTVTTAKSGVAYYTKDASGKYTYASLLNGEELDTTKEYYVTQKITDITVSSGDYAGKKYSELAKEQLNKLDRDNGNIFQNYMKTNDTVAKSGETYFTKDDNGMYNPVSGELQSETPYYVFRAGYTIYSKEELAFLVAYCNAVKNTSDLSLSGKTFTLMNDIDLTGYEWVPIVNYTDGNNNEINFNGNGKTISNVYYRNFETSNIYYNSFFGCWKKGAITNLTFENVDMKGLLYTSIVASANSESTLTFSNITLNNCSVVSGTEAYGVAICAKSYDNCKLNNCSVVVNPNDEELRTVRTSSGQYLTWDTNRTFRVAGLGWAYTSATNCEIKNSVVKYESTDYESDYYTKTSDTTAQNGKVYYTYNEDTKQYTNANKNTGDDLSGGTYYLKGLNGNRTQTVTVSGLVFKRVCDANHVVSEDKNYQLFENLTVDNCEVSSNVNIENEIISSNISSYWETGYNIYTIGAVYCQDTADSANVVMKNITVKNSDVQTNVSYNPKNNSTFAHDNNAMAFRSRSLTTGIAKGWNTSATVSYEDCTVENSDVSGNIDITNTHTFERSGSFVSYNIVAGMANTYGSNTTTVHNTFDNCNVTNSNVAGNLTVNNTCVGEYFTKTSDTTAQSGRVYYTYNASDDKYEKANVTVGASMSGDYYVQTDKYYKMHAMQSVSGMGTPIYSEWPSLSSGSATANYTDCHVTSCDLVNKVDGVLDFGNYRPGLNLSSYYNPYLSWNMIQTYTFGIGSGSFDNCSVEKVHYKLDNSYEAKINDKDSYGYTDDQWDSFFYDRNCTQNLYGVGTLFNAGVTETLSSSTDSNTATRSTAKSYATNTSVKNCVFDLDANREYVDVSGMFYSEGNVKEIDVENCSISNCDINGNAQKENNARFRFTGILWQNNDRYFDSSDMNRYGDTAFGKTTFKNNSVKNVSYDLYANSGASYYGAYYTAYARWYNIEVDNIQMDQVDVNIHRENVAGRDQSIVAYGMGYISGRNKLSVTNCSLTNSKLVATSKDAVFNNQNYVTGMFTLSMDNASGYLTDDITYDKNVVDNCIIKADAINTYSSTYTKHGDYKGYSLVVGNVKREDNCNRKLNVTNCETKESTITANSTRNSAYAVGVCYANDTTWTPGYYDRTRIENCYSTKNDISATRTNQTYIESGITKTYKIPDDADVRASGVAFYVSQAIGCVNTSTVSAVNDKSSAFTCGISYISANKVERCLNFGELSATGSTTSWVAGIAYASTLFDTCANYGTLTGQRVGGITTDYSSYYDETIVNCLNAGDIYDNMRGTSYLGGIIGFRDARNDSSERTIRLENCVSTGHIYTEDLSSGELLSTPTTRCYMGMLYGCFNATNGSSSYKENIYIRNNYVLNNIKSGSDDIKHDFSKQVYGLTQSNYVWNTFGENYCGNKRAVYNRFYAGLRDGYIANNVIVDSVSGLKDLSVKGCDEYTVLTSLSDLYESATGTAQSGTKYFTLTNGTYEKVTVADGTDVSGYYVRKTVYKYNDLSVSSNTIEQQAGYSGKVFTFDDSLTDEKQFSSNILCVKNTVSASDVKKNDGLTEWIFTDTSKNSNPEQDYQLTKKIVVYDLGDNTGVTPVAEVVDADGNGKYTFNVQGAFIDEDTPVISSFGDTLKSWNGTEVTPTSYTMGASAELSSQITVLTAVVGNAEYKVATVSSDNEKDVTLTADKTAVDKDTDSITLTVKYTGTGTSVQNIIWQAYNKDTGKYIQIGRSDGTALTGIEGNKTATKTFTKNELLTCLQSYGYLENQVENLSFGVSLSGTTTYAVSVEKTTDGESLDNCTISVISDDATSSNVLQNRISATQSATITIKADKYYTIKGVTLGSGAKATLSSESNNGSQYTATISGVSADTAISVDVEKIAYKFAVSIKNKSGVTISTTSNNLSSSLIKDIDTKTVSVNAEVSDLEVNTDSEDSRVKTVDGVMYRFIGWKYADSDEYFTTEKKISKLAVTEADMNKYLDSDNKFQFVAVFQRQYNLTINVGNDAFVSTNTTYSYTQATNYIEGTEYYVLNGEQYELDTSVTSETFENGAYYTKQENTSTETDTAFSSYYTLTYKDENGDKQTISSLNDGVYSDAMVYTLDEDTKITINIKGNKRVSLDETASTIGGVSLNQDDDYASNKIGNKSFTDNLEINLVFVSKNLTISKDAVELSKVTDPVDGENVRSATQYASGIIYYDVYDADGNFLESNTSNGWALGQKIKLVYGTSEQSSETLANKVLLDNMEYRFAGYMLKSLAGQYVSVAEIVDKDGFITIDNTFYDRYVDDAGNVDIMAEIIKQYNVVVSATGLTASDGKTDNIQMGSYRVDVLDENNAVIGSFASDGTKNLTSERIRVKDDDTMLFDTGLTLKVYATTESAYADFVSADSNTESFVSENGKDVATLNITSAKTIAFGFEKATYQLQAVYNAEITADIKYTETFQLGDTIMISYTPKGTYSIKDWKIAGKTLEELGAKQEGNTVTVVATEEFLDAMASANLLEEDNLTLNNDIKTAIANALLYGLIGGGAVVVVLFGAVLLLVLRSKKLKAQKEESEKKYQAIAKKFGVADMIKDLKAGKDINNK